MRNQEEAAKLFTSKEKLVLQALIDVHQKQKRPKLRLGIEELCDLYYNRSRKPRTKHYRTAMNSTLRVLILKTQLLRPRIILERVSGLGRSAMGSYSSTLLPASRKKV